MLKFYRFKWSTVNKTWKKGMSERKITHIWFECKWFFDLLFKHFYTIFTLKWPDSNFSSIGTTTTIAFTNVYIQTVSSRINNTWIIDCQAFYRSLATEMKQTKVVCRILVHLFAIKVKIFEQPPFSLSSLFYFALLLLLF